MTEQKCHLSVAATTLLKFLFARPFRHLLDTPFLAFKIFYCAKWRELLGLSSQKFPVWKLAISQHEKANK